VDQAVALLFPLQTPKPHPQPTPTSNTHKQHPQPTPTTNTPTTNTHNQHPQPGRPQGPRLQHGGLRAGQEGPRHPPLHGARRGPLVRPRDDEHDPHGAPAVLREQTQPQEAVSGVGFGSGCGIGVFGGGVVEGEEAASSGALASCLPRLLGICVACGAAIKSTSIPTSTQPPPQPGSWELKKLHPGGLNKDWLDKMHDQLFFSDHVQHTHEHYLQVGGAPLRRAFVALSALLRFNNSQEECTATR